MTARLVTAVIPTFRRPFGFARAARSVFAQRGYGRALELVAVDNDPEGSALPVFRALEKEATVPFRWTHEPRPGVANARNAAVALAQGGLLAFLDDDEEALPGWLAALLSVQIQTGAGAVFGPVQAALPEDVRRHRRYLTDFFSRFGPHESGPISRYHGIGNSLISRDQLFLTHAPFDPAANSTGGEDDRLFALAQARGVRFAWAADALAIEHVSPDRARLAYALRRAFAYGQAPCEAALRRRPVDWAGLARHMTVGAGQLALGAPLAVGAFALGLPGRARLAHLAAIGAGKLIFGVEQRFYGGAALPTRPTRRRPRRAAARVPIA